MDALEQCEFLRTEEWGDISNEYNIMNQELYLMSFADLLRCMKLFHCRWVISMPLISCLIRHSSLHSFITWFRFPIVIFLPELWDMKSVCCEMAVSMIAFAVQWLNHTEAYHLWSEVHLIALCLVSPRPRPCSRQLSSHGFRRHSVAMFFDSYEWVAMSFRLCCCFYNAPVVKEIISPHHLSIIWQKESISSASRRWSEGV